MGLLSWGCSLITDDLMSLIALGIDSVDDLALTSRVNHWSNLIMAVSAAIIVHVRHIIRHDGRRWNVNLWLMFRDVSVLVDVREVIVRSGLWDVHWFRDFTITDSLSSDNFAGVWVLNRDDNASLLLMVFRGGRRWMDIMMDICNVADSMSVDDMASFDIDDWDFDTLCSFRMDMIARLNVRVIVVVDVVVRVGVIVGIRSRGQIRMDIRSITDGVSVDDMSGVVVNDRDNYTLLFWCRRCRRCRWLWVSISADNLM